MGIRGLTTFIRNGQNNFMTNYELANTNLVLDGNGITCYLYNNIFRFRNDAFGGDYDRYGEIVEYFFKQLFSCNITPYVVFDGGYGNAKIPEIMRRMKDKIQRTRNLEQMNRLHDTNVFPLHMWGTFECIAKRLNVKIIRCAFDCDLECANLARSLKCPVLSNDSDFYICDVLYIPLTFFELNVKRRDSSCYISCKIYRVDLFMKYYGNIDKSKLPLLAILIGNDHSDPRDRNNINNLIIPNQQKMNNQLCIQSALLWLQKYSTKETIDKIIDCCGLDRRTHMENTIHRAFTTYTCRTSSYLKYFEEDSKESPSSNIKQCQAVTSGEDNIQTDNAISNYFLENFKRALYPSALMDIVCKNTYFCYPQVEDHTLEGSYKISLEIVSAMHKILTRAKEPLIYLGRTLKMTYEQVQGPSFHKDVPYIDDVQHMDTLSRQNVVAKVLIFKESAFQKLVQYFPNSWHVYILAMQYLTKRTNTPCRLIRALILSKLVLGHVDEKIGYFRSIKSMLEKYPRVTKRPHNTLKNNLIEAISAITIEDCLYCMDACMQLFYLDRNERILDKKLIHNMSQFQACLLQVKTLNELLNCPFENPLISKCLNCTFVYYAAKSPRPIDMLLDKSPTILHCLELICKKLED